MIHVAEHGISGRNIRYDGKQKKAKEKSSPELMIRFKKRRQYSKRKIQRAVYKRLDKVRRAIFPAVLNPSM